MSEIWVMEDEQYPYFFLDHDPEWYCSRVIEVDDETAAIIAKAGQVRDALHDVLKQLHNHGNAEPHLRKLGKLLQERASLYEARSEEAI